MVGSFAKLILTSTAKGPTLRGGHNKIARGALDGALAAQGPYGAPHTRPAGRAGRAPRGKRKPRQSGC
eukprot:2472926-Pyramimonas_sp.AAC.1